jgi:pyruvate dehydrogenase E1 component alpha subunit
VKEGHDVVLVGDTMQRLTPRPGRPQAAFVEICTYRYKEHVGPGDDFDAGYRSRSELLAWQAKDVLIQGEELVARFKPAIEREIAAAVDFAERSPSPGREELLTDII